MASVQVEIRIENEHEVSFIPSNVHAAPDDEILFFATTRGGERIRAGGREASEMVKEDNGARFTITFKGGSPFDQVKLASGEGKINARVSGKPGVYHYALAATTQIGGKAAMISVTGCPEIIIQR